MPKLHLVALKASEERGTRIGEEEAEGSTFWKTPAPFWLDNK